MAKTYAFRFSAIPATFDGDVVGMNLTDMFSSPHETRTLTLANALAYLPQFSAQHPAPHAATITLANRQDRKPAGFDKAATTLYRKEQA